MDRNNWSLEITVSDVNVVGGYGMVQVDPYPEELCCVDSLIGTGNFGIMKVDSDDWRECESLRLLCDRIRRSLREVAALDDDQGAKQGGDEASTSSVATRLFFSCGSARCKDNQNCWILRSSRDSSSKKPRSSASRKKFRYGSVLAGTFSADTDEPMEPYHNASIARVQLCESRGEDVPSSPPVRLIQRIFRTIELRWAFEYLESMISTACNSLGKHTLAEFKKEAIDFEPMFSYLQETCSRYEGEHGRKQVTQDAIAFCSTVTSDDDTWKTAVYDSDGTQTSSKRTARVPRILRSLLEFCLEEDNPLNRVSRPSRAVPPRHTDDSLLEDSSETRHALSTRRRGYEVVVDDIVTRAPSASRRSKRRKTKVSPLLPSHEFPSAIRSLAEHKAVDTSEKEMKPHGRAPRRCMRCVEFDGCGAHDCRGRGGVRHCEYFTEKGISTKQSSRSARSMQSKNNTYKAGASTYEKFVTKLRSPAWMSTEPLGTTATPTRSFHANPKNSENVNWMKLSHMGHISDYHGMQRRYESFFPLTLKSSANEMINDIGRTLEEHHFDELIESDDEVLEENNDFLRVISSYASYARKEKSSKRRRHAEGRPLRHHLFDDNLPFFFVGDECVGREFKECIHCQGAANSIQAEDTVLGPTALLHTFREDDCDPSFFRNGEDRVKEAGRPSRRREIASHQKASLSMLYHLQQSLKFIAAYNLNGEDCSHDDSKESVGLYRLSVKYDPPMLRAPGEATKRHTSDEKDRPLVVSGSIDAKTNHDTVVHDLTSLSLNHLIDACKKHGKKRDESLALVSTSRVPSIQAMREFLNALDECQPEAPSDDDLAEQRNYQRAIRSYRGKADQERIEKIKHEERAQGVMHRSRARKPSLADLELEALETRALVFMTVRTTSNASCPFGTSCTVCRPIETSVTRKKAPMDATILQPSFRRIEEEVLHRCDEIPLENEDTRRNRSRDKAARLRLENERLGHLHRRLDFVELYNKGWILSSSSRRTKYARV